MTTAKTTDTLEALRQNTRNYVVWLDAPGPKDACGQATMEPDTDRNPDTNRSNFGGKVAIVFRQRSGFCNSTAVRHEIAHTLGALREGAPNAIDGAHCGDAYEDTMCVGDAPRIGPRRSRASSTTATTITGHLPAGRRSAGGRSTRAGSCAPTLPATCRRPPRRGFGCARASCAGRTDGRSMRA